MTLEIGSYVEHPWVPGAIFLIVDLDTEFHDQAYQGTHNPTYIYGDTYVKLDYIGGTPLDPVTHTMILQGPRPGWARLEELWEANAMMVLALVAQE